MTIEVKHAFVSGKGDSTDTSLVRPSNWNAVHTVHMSGIALLGRTIADVGVAEEVQLGAGLEIAEGVLTVSAPSFPIGTVVDYAGTSAPTKWLMCYGQTLSRITYSALFVIIGTTYGAGDGTNTFNIPDLRGRVRAGKDNMGGTSADRLTSNVLNGDTLGAASGFDTHTLVTGQLPVHTHTGTTVSAGSHRHFVVNTTMDSQNSPVITAGERITRGNDSGGSASYTLNGTTTEPTVGETSSAGSHTHTFITDASGSATPFSILQPTIIINSIIYTGV